MQICLVWLLAVGMVTTDVTACFLQADCSYACAASIIINRLINYSVTDIIYFIW